MVMRYCVYRGAPALVDKLIEGINIQSGAAITHVHQQEDGVVVENSAGQSQTFDRVVIATPTTKVQDFLDNQKFAEDIELLKQFKFEQGDLVIHTDPRR